jgi:hypothetical protein
MKREIAKNSKEAKTGKSFDFFVSFVFFAINHFSHSRALVEK